MAENKSYPYTYARISAMKTTLIPRSEYQKLVKMEVDSITRYLQDKDYKDEITKWSAQYKKLRLIDYALNDNFKKTTQKLNRICGPVASKLLSSYLKKVYFQNMKILIRGVYSNSSFEEVEPLLTPAGNLDSKYYKELFDLNSVDKILERFKVLRTAESKELIDEFNKNLKLIDVENRLDKILFRSQLYKAKKLADDNRAYEKFIRTEIDIANIKTILRLKNEHMTPDQIRNYIVPGGLGLKEDTLNKLVNASIEEVNNELNNSIYGKKINFSAKGSMLDLELELEKYLTKVSYIKSSSNPLSILCVVSYLLSKINEMRNIRKIVKAKHFGLDNDFIENKLIIS